MGVCDHNTISDDSLHIWNWGRGNFANILFYMSLNFIQVLRTFYREDTAILFKLFKKNIPYKAAGFARFTV